MSKRSIRERGEYVKSVPLSPEQARAARVVFSAGERLQRILWDLLRAANEDQAASEDEMWSDLAKLAGFTDTDDAQRQGYSFAVEYGTRLLKVYHNPDIKPEEE